MFTVRKIVSCSLIALCGLILIVAALQQRAPMRMLYAGQDAIFWSQALTGTFSQRTNAEHALRAMGPAAAGDLADILDLKPKMRDRFLVAFGRHLPTRLNWLLLKSTGVLDPQVLPAIAARGLEVLGPAARAVVPEMEAAIPVSNPNVYGPLINALAKINPEGFSALGRILRRGEETRQGCVALQLQSLGTNALPLLPDVIYLMTNQQPGARFAVLVLGAMGESALPSILPLLDDKDKNLVSLGILTLRNMGSPAQQALPLLLRSATNGAAEIRALAIRAIGNIAPTRPDCLIVLKTAASDRDPGIRLAAVDALQNAPLRVWRDPALFNALVEDPDPQIAARAQMAFGKKNPLDQPPAAASGPRNQQGNSEDGTRRVQFE